MKKEIVVMSIVFTTAVSFAATPAPVVKKAFDQKFPTATNVIWCKKMRKNEKPNVC